jgi:hypothetical protein
VLVTVIGNQEQRSNVIQRSKRVAFKTAAKKQSKASVVMTTAATSASWMALLAATTIGLGNIQRVRAEVSANIQSIGEAGIDGYRLIVQSYPRASLAQGDLPGARVRPLGSAQRAITLEELAHGVSVDVVGVGEALDEDAVVVAWVERGKPDLEFDALRARPTDGAVYGTGDAQAASAPRAQIVLNRRRA